PGAAATGLSATTPSSGVATFSSIKIYTAGTYTLKATNGKLTAATSASFIISPSTASQLAFATLPSTAVAGASLTGVVVSVEDDFGNVVTGDTSSVAVAIADSTGA